MDSTAVYLPTVGKAAITLRGAPSAQRQAVHIVFAVDTSDSMNDDDKLTSVKKSIEFILPLLTQDDLVSVVTFGESSEVILRQLPASDTSILYKVSSLETNGCTNLSAGLMSIRDCIYAPDISTAELGGVAPSQPSSPYGDLELGIASNPPSPRADVELGLVQPQRKVGVLLLTDGHANRGVSDSAGLKDIVNRILTDTPLTLTTVGYGTDHNSELLTQMATDGTGSYNVVKNLEDVASVFGEVLGGMTTVVAQNITITLPPGSTPHTGYSTKTLTDGSIQIRVGDIYAENEIVVLFNAPPDSTIKVTGANMLTLAQINTTFTPAPIGIVPKSIELASFRYEVSSVLKLATATTQTPATLRSTASDLLTQLRALPYVTDQLVQMMIDDLERLLESLQSDQGGLGRMTSVLRQHAAYMDLSRGLRSAVDDDPHTPPRSMRGLSVNTGPPRIVRTRTANVDTTFSPFSNRIQRMATNTMRANASQQDESC